VWLQGRHLLPRLDCLTSALVWISGQLQSLLVQADIKAACSQGLEFALHFIQDTDTGRG
jgi:hypothetical protein